MSKNTPITARVSTGLFNKKKGATEPLLNVGKAGVHGNNQTRDIPSPSKIKGYAMKSSPFKQTMTDGTAVEAEVRGTGDMITEKGKEKTKTVNTDTYDGSGGYASKEEWAKFLKTPQGKAYTEKNTKQVGTGEYEPDTKKQGPEKKINLKDFEVEGKRGMVESWEAGSQGRRMKKLSDDISDSEKKVGRYTSRLAKHTDTKTGKAKKGHERRFRNATANLAESQRNVKASQGQYDVYSKGVSRGASGYHGGTFNVTEQATKKSLGDVKQQIAFETKQSGIKNTKKDATNTNPLETPLEKSNKFFKKTTPLKMKYFK